MSSGYAEFCFWSPMLGQDAARISMCNDSAAEYFMIIPNDGGRAYLDQRNEAVEAIAEAIELGLEPGQVSISA